MEAVAIVLAAGMGTRMKSHTVKVLHHLCGKPMLEHVIEALQAGGIQRIVVVVGHQHEKVMETIGNAVSYVYQAEQLGTGHAVLQAEMELKGYDGPVLVTYGDAPLYRPETFANLVRSHARSGFGATILSAIFDDPTGYGRILRRPDGSLDRIVEHKDATLEEREITEINTGTYVFDSVSLFAALRHVKADNKAGEYYLPDALSIIQGWGKAVNVIVADDPGETVGINNRVQLAEAEKMLRKRIRERLMLDGVTMLDPETVFIDSGVTIGPDTVIYPGVFIEGSTSIGQHCVIGPNVHIRDSLIADFVSISQSVVVGSRVGDEVQIGPFSYLRPGTVAEEGTKVGGFVEVKNSMLGKGSKVPHLSYIGDCTVGERVNIGAGTITCNYDGREKHRTVIGDDVFIGSNTNLVAPVTIADKAFVAAGSTITKNVGSLELGIARARQKNISGWVARKRVIDKE